MDVFILPCGERPVVYTLFYRRKLPSVHLIQKRRSLWQAMFENSSNLIGTPTLFYKYFMPSAHLFQIFLKILSLQVQKLEGTEEGRRTKNSFHSFFWAFLEDWIFCVVKQNIGPFKLDKKFRLLLRISTIVTTRILTEFSISTCH